MSDQPSIQGLDQAAAHCQIGADPQRRRNRKPGPHRLPGPRCGPLLLTWGRWLGPFCLELHFRTRCVLRISFPLSRKTLL